MEGGESFEFNNDHREERDSPVVESPAVKDYLEIRASEWIRYRGEQAERGCDCVKEKERERESS